MVGAGLYTLFGSSIGSADSAVYKAFLCLAAFILWVVLSPQSTIFITMLLTVVWPAKQEQYKKERLGLLCEHVQSINPDIICLQEVTMMWYSNYYRKLHESRLAELGYARTTHAATCLPPHRTPSP